MPNVRNEALRTKLLECAIRHFAQKGYAGANLMEIAAEVGVTRGPVYYYFAGKAELFEAAVEHVIETTKQAYERILDPAAPVESVIRADYEYCLEEKGLFFLSQSDTMSMPQVQSAWDEFSSWLVARKQQVFEAAAARGELAPDCDIAELITFIYAFFYGIEKVRPIAEKIDGFNTQMLTHSTDVFMSIIKQRYLNG